MTAKYSVCGVEIARCSLSEAVGIILDAARSGQPLQAHLCNTYTLSLVDSDPVLRSALLSADLNLADGAPVAWLGRRFGMRGPVRGPNLLRAVAEHGRAYGVRHYFYGGAPAVAASVAERLSAEFDGLLVAGVESPAYREPSASDLDSLAKNLSDSHASILWLGLGTPRQDYVVPEITSRSGLVVVPVGAAFDFIAGTVREAPLALQGYGLEWTYRLASEPRRLWRRYLVGGPRFARAALQHARKQSRRTP
jgi:N-acetylglucosaminyldiphosphoundecaprenol N-acetyl-beta-D-mannosaminyltransferase